LVLLLLLWHVGLLVIQGLLLLLLRHLGLLLSWWRI
jgi:hypothetical protein